MNKNLDDHNSEIMIFSFFSMNFKQHLVQQSNKEYKGDEETATKSYVFLESKPQEMSR